MRICGTMRSRTAMTAALAIAVVAAASCGGSSRAPAADPAKAGANEPEAPRPQWPAWARVPWPSGDPALAQALRHAELTRDPGAEAIDRAWHHAEPAWRARAAWTLARIGGAPARDRMAGWLADGRITLDASTLAAYALLSAPGADEPRAPGWDALEDRLWTRYAVTDDADEAAASLLALARIGGTRSPERLAVDLAVLPTTEAQAQRHVQALDALAILCARGHGLPRAGLDAVALALTASSPEVPRTAAQTLGRCAAASAEQLAGIERGALVERLVPMVGLEDPEGARRAWAALQGLGELPRVIPTWVLGPGPTDWMAEVAAVRALTAHADGRKVLVRRLGGLSPDAFVGPRLHVLRVTLEGLRPHVAQMSELEAPLRALAAEVERARDAAGADPRRAKALTLIDCELRLLLATRDGGLDSVRGCAVGHDTLVPADHGERLSVEALVHMGPVMPVEQRVAELETLAADTRPWIAASALTAMAGLDDPSINEVLRRALAGDDMGVVAAAAGAIGTRASDRSRRDPQAATALLGVVQRFDDAHAIETRITAIDALGRLARSASTEPSPPTSPEAADEGDAATPAPKDDAEPTASDDAEPTASDDAEPTAAPSVEPTPWLASLVPLARDPAVAVRAAARRALQDDPELLAAFDAQVPTSTPDAFVPAVHAAVDRFADGLAGLRLHTDAGAITIDFRGAPAPIAQANLAALAERGFFDGLRFHRVVPGFVIQGGDPRGDGYGGPGHVMPCEWSSLRYERGTVGIALAGKDTGGSQLFVTHDRPQHLDARYTVIGRVVDGLETVDAIWPYDRITRVEVLASLEPAGTHGSTP